MAGTLSYNSTYTNNSHIFQATGGGSVFSADLAGTAAFNYFSNTAVVNDAIYFATPFTYYVPFSDLKLNVGTALAATSYTLVWEYYYYPFGTWVPIPNLTDNTSSLSVTGANTVVFPIPPYWRYTAVNGLTSNWIRARLSAVTGLTNGGANQTSAPQSADGTVYAVGYTAASPLTCDSLYTWMQSNTPIPVRKEVNSFVFAGAINNSASSYWQTQEEVILLGNGSGYLSLSVGGMVAGIPIGSYGGMSGSVILISATAGGPPADVSSATFYDSVVRRGFYYDPNQNYQSKNGNIPNRLSISNTTAQASILEGAGYPHDGTTVRRCVLPGQVIAYSAFSATDAASGAIFCNNGAIFNFYFTNETYWNIVWSSTSYLMTTNSTSTGSPVLTFVNPTPALPNAAATSAPYLWDSSVGTYNQQVTVDEKYTLDLTVQDKDGNPLSGVTVSCVNSSGGQDFATTTASDGTISQQVLLARHFYYDGTNSNVNHVASTDTIVHTLTLRKAGYQSKTVPLSMQQQRVEVQVLEKSVPLLTDGRTLYLNLVPAESQNQLLMAV